MSSFLRLLSKSRRNFCHLDGNESIGLSNLMSTRRRFDQSSSQCRWIIGPAVSPSEPQQSSAKPETRVGEYFAKLKGQGTPSPPAPPLTEILASGATAFGAMAALSCLHFGITSGSDLTLILGSMGATVVLVYGAPHLPLAQPRNVVAGHLVSCVVGVACQQLIAAPMGSSWLAAPTAVSSSIMAMQALRCLHPPAGGTALIAAMGSQQVQDMGFLLLVPTGVGAVLLTLGGIAFNNLIKGRRYPHSWW
eukprot:jgi/Mesvir1/12402/Mv00571-RA.1